MKSLASILLLTSLSEEGKDQMLLLVLALAALLFTVAYLPNIWHYIKQQFLHKHN
jgi:hypothetical protein